MRKSKDNKLLIQKQLGKIVNKQQNIIQIAKYVGSTKKVVDLKNTLSMVKYY